MATVAAVVGLEKRSGKAFGFVSALAVGLAALAQRRVDPQAIQNWTRALGVGGHQAEVNVRLANACRYATGSPDATLADQVDDPERIVGDLLPHTQGIDPPRTVMQQITEYDKKPAAEQQRLLARARAWGIAPALAGVVLAAAATTWEIDSLPVLAPVVTGVILHRVSWWVVRSLAQGRGALQAVRSTRVAAVA